MGVANYYKNALFNVGGKILLTERNLYFSSHTFAQGKTDLCLNLHDIKDVVYNANMIISDQISVITSERKHKFVVYGGKEWIRMIKEAARNAPPVTERITHRVVPKTERVSYVKTSNTDYTEELVKLKKLCDAGVITEEEFTIKKRQLLGI